MALAVLVVDWHPAVEQLAELGRAERLLKFDREQSLGLVEDEATVAVRTGDQRIAGFGSDGEGPVLEHFGAADQFLERFMVEPAKDQNLATRQERGVDLEAGVFGRRSDERHRAVLDIGQEPVLLGAVEAVNLVHEQ